MGQTSMATLGFYTKGKGDECHEGLMLGVKEI